jgi:hypothetical protein
MARLPRCGATTVLLDGHGRWRGTLEVVVEEEEEEEGQRDELKLCTEADTVAEKRQQRLARMRHYAGR